MKKQPLVSILIPMYNSSKFLEETLQCAINQTYKNIEIIVQDDFSTDNSVEIAQKIANIDSRINVFSNSMNMGMCKNWNSIFEKAQGDYILKLDADDLIKPDIISILIEKGIESNADIVSAAYEFLFKDSSHKQIPIHNNLNEGIVHNLLSTIIFNNPFHLVFSILRKDFIDSIKLNDKYFMQTEVGDAEFLIRSALNNAKLYFVPIPLGYYRIHDNNSSNTPLKQTSSFYFDVLPLYHITLKNHPHFNYTKKINIDTWVYIKQILKRTAPFNSKLLFQMIKLRF